MFSLDSVSTIHKVAMFHIPLVLQNKTELNIAKQEKA